MTRPLIAQAMTERVLVADGAMGTMLQAAGLTSADFAGHDGCNELLNATRPDVVEAVHRAYFDVGVDAVETNTFGANLPNLAEYGIADRIEELALLGAQIARKAADSYSDGRPRWVIGSMGPGTKLPSLGHAPYAQLRDAYQHCARGLALGGADLILVETCQDILGAKAAVNGARRAMRETGTRLPIVVHLTVETTGTLLLGTETPAALAALEPLGIAGIGLNCATGPAEMGEHLRTLATSTRLLLSVMPNAGLPTLGPDGALYPLGPQEFADAVGGFVTHYGMNLVGGCCGTTPDHLAALVERVGVRAPAVRHPVIEPSVSSLYQAVTLHQDASYLAVGERTNANGSKAFREAMVAGDMSSVVAIAQDQARDGAHLLDVCTDYVGRDGAADMRAVAATLATASTLPLMIDSTEPAVMEAGLEMLGGRCVVNSVNFEDGDGPDSRLVRTMRVVQEHGAAVVALTIDEQGQARTAEHKVRVARRLIATLGTWGLEPHDILLDCLTFPIATGQEETRRDGVETLEAIRQLRAQYPQLHFTLGVSNISFGLTPAARVVLNSVFLAEAVAAGLDSAIVHAGRIVPVASIEPEPLRVALDLIYDRREFDDAGQCTYDPLATLLELFAGVSAADLAAQRASALEGLELPQRIEQRVVQGLGRGMAEDLDAALGAGMQPLDIINSHLLEGMRIVGELFGSGQMQLPFVLASAEVMKQAVAHLEPHMPTTENHGRGTVLLATVKGDVHDIGKNLVDIILSNNGYDVVNLGIKQPISDILTAAEEHHVDVIGMSGLLVKSTQVMKENLEEMQRRGLAGRWPVILGGAALTRAFVEQDLASQYAGEVRYARDAFEGLRLAEPLVHLARGEQAELPPLRGRRVPAAATSVPDAGARACSGAGQADPTAPDVIRSDVATNNPIPDPPFWGTRVVRGLALADYAALLDERALFRGQWGLRATRDGVSYEELVEREGRPRLRAALDRIRGERLAQAAVVYGYFPCYSQGNDLVILDGDGTTGHERARFTFPRQRRDRRLCLADFFRPRESGVTDVVALQLVTMGPALSQETARLFQENSYRDYLELHGLSVQLTEALAEFWHQRIRAELGFAAEDDRDPQRFFQLSYRGARYSFGYPACPDLAQREILFDLLDAGRIGVELSEEDQLHPEQSTDAIVVHHPEAKYFNAT